MWKEKNGFSYLNLSARSAFDVLDHIVEGFSLTHSPKFLSRLPPLRHGVFVFSGVDVVLAARRIFFEG